MDLAYTPNAYGRLDVRSRRAGDTYLVFLGCVLLGYALFSRSFAYVGVPPLFIGEISLGVGLLTLFRSGGLGRWQAQPIAWLLACYIVLAAVRMVPYLGEHGLDAPRDAMQVFYAFFAVTAGGLILAKPERLAWIVRHYNVVAVACTFLLGSVYLIGKMGESSLPMLPWGNARIIEAKGGDMMVHLTGITLFVLMGFRKRSPLLLTLLVADIAIIAISNRGGMMAFLLGCGAAWVLRPRTARVGKFAYIFVVFLVLGSVVGQLAEVKVNGGTRELSVEQLVTNVKSVFVGGDSQSLDGTKKWRLDWWEKIIDYTIRDGTYFWTGKGFGINLAKSDGFLAVKDLRSPHNGHLTILARMGVPGLALWLLLQLSWCWMGIGAWFRARRRDDARWMGLLAMLAGYWIAFNINASFDVYFEGPMGGIWFWTVWGVGVAAFTLERTRPEVLDAVPMENAEPPPEPEMPWGWDAPRVAAPPPGSSPGAPPAARPSPRPAPAFGWTPLS